MKECDGCECLRFEPPVNQYDVWLALCESPDKPAWMGPRRTVATAPYSSDRGPFGIPRPAWCGRRRIAASASPPRNDGGGEGKRRAATVAETP